MLDERNWCVYRHKNIVNNKVYIGITSLKPENRWLNGQGYKKQKIFYGAIIKYGWNSFEHKVLFSNLTEEEASWKEKFLIKYYKSNINVYGKTAKGYNATDGGSGSAGKKTIRKNIRPVVCYDKKWNLLGEYISIAEASRCTGDHISSIQDCVSKRVMFTNNHIWRYKNDLTDFGTNLSYKKGMRKKVYITNINNKDVLIFNSIKEATIYIGCSEGVIRDIASKRKKNNIINEKFIVFVEQNESDKKNYNCKKVNKLDLNGKYICTYQSVTEASKENNISTVSIRRVCKHYIDPRDGTMAKTAGGYIWEYVQ